MLSPREVVLKCVKAVKEFTDTHVDPDTYVTSFVETQNIQDVGDADFLKTVFSGCLKHKPMLKVVVDGYYADVGSTCPSADKTLYTVLCYLTMVSTRDVGIEGIHTMLMALPRTQMTKGAKFLEFAWNSNAVLSWIKDAWCSVYDTVYVDTELLDPIVDAMDNMHDAIANMYDHVKTRNTITPTPQKVTKPKPFNLTQPRAKPIKVPTAVSTLKKHIPPPRSTYESPIELEARERKRQMAMTNTRLARERGADKRKMTKLIQEQEATARVDAEILRHNVVVKPTTLPKTTRKHVPIKLNAGAILREEQLFRSRAEKESKRLKDVEAGAFDIEAFLEWERRIQAQEEQEKLDEIEIRRLQGLISREDAVLARQNTVKENKKVAHEQKKITQALMERYIAEKVAQGEMNRRMVKDTALLYARVKKAKEDHAAARAAMKRQMDEESKAMLKDAAEREAIEMEKRAELIRQIRALELNPVDRKKVVDFSETAGLGLLAEMSLIELKERLSMLAAQHEKQEKEKRDMILKQKKEAEISLARKVQSIAAARDELKRNATLIHTKNTASRASPRKPDARVEMLKAKLAAKKTAGNAVRESRRSTIMQT